MPKKGIKNTYDAGVNFVTIIQRRGKNGNVTSGKYLKLPQHEYNDTSKPNKNLTPYPVTTYRSITQFPSYLFICHNSRHFTF